MLIHKITPHLWFDSDAKTAVNFYSKIFPDFKILNVSDLDDVPTPSGETNIINFEISGQPFIAINAGPIFTKNPSISFFINFDPSQDLNALANLKKTWAYLSDGGKVLMDLGQYPFSELYGWVEDKFGVSWQLILTNPNGELRPNIIPSLLFTKEFAGKAEEAINYYVTVFGTGSKIGSIVRYPEGMGPDKPGTLMYSEFHINGTWIVAMDSAQDHKFKFSEGISLLIPCDTQEEIDHYWSKLSHDSSAEQCGWLRDKFGVSWQVWPTKLGEFMQNGTQDQKDRVTQAFLKMKKYNLAELELAYKG